jgi:hypothetical protein
MTSTRGRTPNPLNPMNTCATPGASPAPLGSRPSEEALLDLALECTFPASDPIAVDPAQVERAERRRDEER